MTVDDHPSFEDLSAYHDGEAPEWAAHVGACPACRDTVAALSSLSAAVAGRTSADAGHNSADAGHTSADAGDPVARAVAAAAQGSDVGDIRADAPPTAAPPPRPTPLPSRARWLAAAAAAAAVVVVAVGLTVVLRRSNTPDSTTTAAGPARNTQEAAPEAAVGGPAPAADSAAGAPTAVVGGDLGDIRDPATLLAKVGPLLSSGRGLAGEGGADAPAAPPVRSSVPGFADVPEPGVVGTRPCETEARAGQPALGDVLYVATANSAGTPAVVLAFAPASGTGRVTVAMLATADCRLLFQATTP